VGAGPTGLEFAAELNDCIQEDFSKLFPDEVPLSSVTLVSSSPDLLSSYDSRVSEFTNKLLGESECAARGGAHARAAEARTDAPSPPCMAATPARAGLIGAPCARVAASSLSWASA
jgi:hypothetical protein